MTATMAPALHSSTTGSSAEDSVLALMLATRFSSLISSNCAWLAPSWAKAWTTRTAENDSASSPVSLATVMRVTR